MLAVICVGVAPEHIVCAMLVMVLLVTGDVTVTAMAEVASDAHAPDETDLINQVFCDNVPGE